MKSSPVEALPLLQGLPPLIDERSQVLILGSFPSEESLRKQQYYAYSRNQFWPIMGKLFDFDWRLPYAERVESLLDRRVAVWDVISRCRRAGSADQAIHEDEPNALIDLVVEHKIRHIAFNGGRAAGTATRRVPRLFELPGLTFHQMPSTSPAHASRSLEEKVSAWSRLREWLEVRAA
jgi:hypoxanthine-DNA glycosylase